MNKDTSKIPKGVYCYDENGNCPYWSLNDDKPYQMNGYCSYLEYGDWSAEIPEDFPEGFPLSCLSLLWDACKQCSINLDEEIIDL